MARRSAAAVHQSAVMLRRGSSAMAESPTPPSRQSSAWLDFGTGHDAWELSGRTEEGVPIPQEPTERLSDHAFELTDADGSKYHARFNMCGQMSIAATLVITMFCFVLGASLPSFRMQSLGIVGKLLDLGQSDELSGTYDRPFSIFVLTGFVAGQADDTWASQVGVRGICALFLFCAFIVPVLQTLALTWLWWMELTLRQQKLVLVANEVLSAWQYLEVYIIAIIVAILQMRDLSAVMMQPICHLIKPTLNVLRTLELIDDVHTECFYVDTSVQPGCFLLLIAAILLNLSHQFITRAAGAAIEDREMLRRGLPLVPHYTYFQWLMVPCQCCVNHADGEERHTLAASDGAADVGAETAPASAKNWSPTGRLSSLGRASTGGRARVTPGELGGGKRSSLKHPTPGENRGSSVGRLSTGRARVTPDGGVGAGVGAKQNYFQDFQDWIPQRSQVAARLRAAKRAARGYVNFGGTDERTPQPAVQMSDRPSLNKVESDPGAMYSGSI